jgi:hypothetical protein
MLRTLTAFSFLAASALGQGLTFGNLYVVRVGDGSAPLSSTSTPTFVDEYTTTGVFVQTIALPTIGSGSNQPFTNAGSSTSEGFLNQSANGFYLTLAGYATGPGTTAVPQTTSTAVPRVVARIDLTGTIDTSTTITDAYSGATGSNANIRSAVSDDGLGFWTAGTAMTNGGVRYVTLGSATSTAINSGAPQNTRVVGIHNGQLYTSSASTVYQGVCTVGTGLPTVGPAPVTLLPGMPTTSGPSTYDFWFADAQTLYVADDGSGSGIKKWVDVAGTWVNVYTLASGTACRGLTGRRAGGVTTLWATTGSSIIRIADTGPSATFTAIATAPTNTAFRGLRLLRKPSSVVRIPAACTSVGIDMAGNGEIGTDIVTTVLNPTAIPLINYSTTLLGFPFCGPCIAVSPPDFIVSGPQHVFSIPPNPTFVGITVYAQGIDFLALGGCPSPLLTLTDGFAFTLQ